MKHRRRVVLALLATGLAGAAVWRIASSSRESDAEILLAARKAFIQGRNGEAETLAKQALARRPEWQGALLIAGRAAAQAGRHEEAFGFLDRAVEQGGLLSSEAAFVAAELRLDLGQPTPAESLFRQVLQTTPGHGGAIERLSHLLNITGRRWEAAPHLLEMVRKGNYDAETLVLLGDLDALVESPQELEAMRRASPDDPAPLVGLARVAVAGGDLPQAESLLRQALAIDPKPIEGQAQLGWVLLERGDEAGLVAWNAQLPSSAGVHPTAWLVRGLWARSHNQPQAACRCFWETLRRDPNNEAAHANLSELLDPNHPSRGHEMLVSRTEMLAQLKAALSKLDPARRTGDTDGDIVERMTTTATLCEQLGRLWEAWAWYGLILKVAPSDARALREYSRIVGLLTPGTPQVLTVNNPSAVINLSTSPLPEWPRADGASAMRNAAREVGAEFVPADDGDALTGGASEGVRGASAPSSAIVTE